MINLIVEDGSGVDDANSYVNTAYARQYAENVGKVLPTDDDACKAALIAAMTYVEGQALRYQGHTTTETQALSWPRNLAGFESNVIPTTLKNAQVSAAILINDGEDLLPTVSGQFVTKEKVGPIETEYSDEYLATLTGRAEFTSIDILLQPLFVKDSGYRLPSFGF